LGLRDFRSGDALKSINWKAMARVQKLVVSEYEPHYETQTAELRLIYHHDHHSKQSERDFERSLAELMGTISLLIQSQVEFEYCSSWSDWEPLSSQIYQLDQFQRLLSSLKSKDLELHSPRKRPSYGNGINIVVSPEPFSRWSTVIKGKAAEIYSVENQTLVKRGVG
jgi:uncharacterized protein (DUF58 family)